MKVYIITLLLALSFVDLSGQRLQMPTLSPFSEIKQQIGLTEITVQYSRPSAKGRQIMGGLVPYDIMWRTGANASTKIITTESTTIGGHKVEAGTYAIYTIPGKEKWTVIIHGNTGMRSIAGDVYKKEDDICRFEVEATEYPMYEETFTMQLADLTTNSCNIRLTWEHTLVNIPIEVEVDSKIESQISELVSDMNAANHRALFQAAEYYMHNGKSLDKATEWIDTALEKNPKNFRYGLLKAKIQFRGGKHAEAMETIDMAHGWAKDANNANYMEQTRLFKEDMLKSTMKK